MGSQIYHTLAIMVISFLLVGCAAQSISSQNSVPASSAMNDPGGWYVIVPPQRAYASDRLPEMGGPLATSGIPEHRGAYEVYSLTQMDTSAPLSQWKRVAGVFSSDADCEGYRAAQLKKINEPATITQIVAKHPSLAGVYVRGLRERYESERCVGASQLSSH
jgi:hypothetical protein